VRALVCLVAGFLACDTPIARPAALAGTAFLHKPFGANYLNLWQFDHDLPVNAIGPERATRGVPGVLSWRGEQIDLSWGNGNGHDGHDWLLDTGTPVLAAADGEVEVAGFEPETLCGDRMTAALIVRILHASPSGRAYATLYAHLDSTIVAPSQWVRAGDVIGYAGSTGCSSGPHLHFTVFDVTAGRRRVDPFGWSGAGPDPWALEPDGATSEWLWLGEPPDGGP
jgi:murein DD-endopeptidase MepM/ murein hydrolase activator NlpD